DTTDSPYQPTIEGVLYCDTSSGNITIQLMTCNYFPDKVYHIVKTSASNTVTINASGSDTIDGGASIALTALNESVTLTNDGISAWSSDAYDVDETFVKNVGKNVTSVQAIGPTGGIGIYQLS